MFTLLLTAFLPKVGVQFDWVTYHWIAGAVLTLSIMFHIIHASFFMDSGRYGLTGLTCGTRRMLRFMGKPAPLPERFAKYPLENKLYHAAIIAAGPSAIVTGVFMMFRVRTIFFPRNPYLFGDMTWGMMYVLHGLAGVGLIALIMMHVYFGLRPEKREITKSMIFGWMDRDFYLKEHDPARWPVETSAPPISPLGRTTCCGRTFDFRPPTRSTSCGPASPRRTKTPYSGVVKCWIVLLTPSLWPSASVDSTV